MRILAAVHLAIANRMRVVAAAGALMLIGIAIAMTAGNGHGGSKTAAPATGTAPQAGSATEVAREEAQHEHEPSIYVIDLKSRRLKQVTESQIAQQPAWAPNNRITFSSALCDDACYSQLFYVDARGSNQVLVPVKAKHHLFHPTWSPDGRRIAAVMLGQGLFTVSPGDRKPRKLTTGQTDEAPAWSPRSDWIAFDRPVTGSNYDLFAINATTRKLRRLTRDPLQQTNPAWSPDGSRLAFAEQQPNGNWAIFTMKLDGSGRNRVTSSKMSAQEPAWSPDGKRIAFTKQGLDRAAVAVVNADGTGKPEVLTRRSLFPAKPAWSPDSTRIAFSAAPSGTQ